MLLSYPTIALSYMLKVLRFLEDLEWLIGNDIQVDATFKANSGHPGAPMGMAPIAHVMFNKFMTFNPKSSGWVNRDRFVLS